MEYSAPPIGMQAEESAAAVPAMRGAVPFPGNTAGGSAALPPWLRAAMPLPGGAKMPGETVPPPPPTATGYFLAPIEPRAGVTAPPATRGAVAEGSVALPLWLHGSVPLPGQMSEESAPPEARAAPPPPEKKVTTSEALDAIADMADRLGISASAKERAKDVFKKMEELKGKSHHYYIKSAGRGGDKLYAACLFVACRSEGTPRTFKEFALATRDGPSARKDIGKLTSIIRKRLGDEAGGEAMDIGVVRAADYMKRFGSLLGMEEQEVRAAQEAARRLQERLDVRRNPDSTAAAIIFMAARRLGSAPKTFREVSIASGVAEGTIKQAYRELCPHAELLFG